MQLVEINISSYIDGNINYLADMQARVIECESWGKYISYFTEYNGEAVGDYISINGNLRGFVLPRRAEIYDLECDDHKLTCTVYNYANQATKKIACVVQ